MSASLIVAAAVAAFVFDLLPGDMRDFEVYWTAAARAAAGEPLYRAEDGHYQFKYLPAFAVLAAPVAVLPVGVAKAAWFVLSVALLTGVVWMSVAVIPRLHRPGWVLAASVVVAMGKFFGHEMVLGQVNLLFAATILAALLLLQRERVAASVTLLVFAVVVKPYAVLFLPWIASLRGKRALAAMAAGLVVILLLPLLFYPADAAFDLHRAWWLTVTGSTAPNLTNADNVSLAGFFAKWLGGGRAAQIGAGLAGVALVAMAAVVIWNGRDIPGREVLEASLLLTLIPLLSPQGWDYVFLIAAPAVAVFANYDTHLPRGWRLATWIAIAAIGLSLFDILGRRNYATFMAWSVITVCFVVLAASLTALRVRRVA